MDGIIPVNKPYGFTSHQVVQHVRKLFRGVKAGHAGTLDPAATGVLPVCLGRATRVVEYIMDHPKLYRAGITLGVTTDTGDAKGEVTGRLPVPCFDRARIERALDSFTGTIEQVPPRYSALKHRGKPMYYWARRDIKTPDRPRMVNIYRLDLLNYHPGMKPQLYIDVQCSKGTYIRTLATDLGRILGCGGHLGSLSRLAVGPFFVVFSYLPLEVEDLFRRNRQDSFVLPMDSALGHFPAITLAGDRVDVLRMGKTLDFYTDDESRDLPEDRPVRVYDQYNVFRALATVTRRGNNVCLKTLKYLSSQ